MSRTNHIEFIAEYFGYEDNDLNEWKKDVEPLTNEQIVGIYNVVQRHMALTSGTKEVRLEKMFQYYSNNCWTTNVMELVKMFDLTVNDVYQYLSSIDGLEWTGDFSEDNYPLDFDDTKTRPFGDADYTTKQI